MSRSFFRRAVAGLTLAFAAVLLAPAAAAVAVPHNPTPGGGGSYVNKAIYNPGAPSTRGWKISWVIPQDTNNAWMAEGQWYFGFETGIFHTDTEGWWVYYYGDDDGLTGNNPQCFQSWGSGGHCQGAMENLQPGAQVTFTYQWCTAAFVPSVTGTYNCAWVDMHDGVGNRFLAGELRTNQTVEMYTHEIETFGDTGAVEPIVPCTAPVKMTGQQIWTTAGAWQNLTGNQWTFEDNSPKYKFQNVNTSANPATWESCSETVACPAAWVSNQLYATDTVVGWKGHKWRAKWWTYGNEPGVTNAWDDLGAC